MKYKIIADTIYEKEQILKKILSFIIYYLVALRPSLDHYRGNRITHSVIITAFIQVSTQRSQPD